MYSQADAARLLGMRPARLRRWIHGYTYRPGPASPELRHRDPVVFSDVPRVDGQIALSFLELMELRVVMRLVQFPGISLQKVRKAGDVASDLLETRHPFASRRIFTDGRDILAALEAGSSAESDLVELTHSRASQIVSAELMRPILEEIDYSEETTLAELWWPRTKAVPIVLNPRIMFGAPTIASTRITTSVLARLAAHDKDDVVATAYDISTDAVRHAVEFEATLLAA
ncbi:MAG: DUF433 domain-containing protein [Gemmatimonadota bacterium]